MPTLPESSRWLFLALVTLAAGATAPAHAALIYQQPPQFPGTFNALTSQNQASGADFQAYDNFTLGTTTTIGALTWQGFYWNPNGQAFNPAAPNTTQFEIGFFQDNLGVPGNLIGSAIVLTSLKTAVVGTTSFGPDLNGQLDTVRIMNFSANLSSSFTASAGTKYWLSIVSFASGYPPEWLWTSGTGGDGISAQLQYSTNLINQKSGDRAYSLYTSSLGQPPPGIPEPATVVLAVLGAVGLFRTRRRSPSSQTKA